jgi:hypothetical protein
MTDYKARANQPGYELDFERIYLAEHARCLELEAQLNSLRDAAREFLHWYNTAQPLSWIDSREIAEHLQDELNKE